MAGQTKAKKMKRSDNTPRRARYWIKRTLLHRKVRNLIRCNGVPPEIAEQVWLHLRGARRVSGPIRNMIALPLAKNAPERKWVLSH